MWGWPDGGFLCSLGDWAELIGAPSEPGTAPTGHRASYILEIGLQCCYLGSIVFI